jgi:HD-GYP domain-containing protein (c-di-GMP phosphodiesterase class II)
MIIWTDEDVKFICDNMINPVIEQMVKLIESSHDSHSRVIDNVIDALNKVTYRQSREISFLKMLVATQLNLSPKKVEELRKEYFKQFDELNKERNV